MLCAFTSQILCTDPNSIVFFAYIGFDAVSTTAQEAKNPQRDLPIGIIGSLTVGVPSEGQGLAPTGINITMHRDRFALRSM